MANSETPTLVSGSKAVTTAGTAVVLAAANRVQSLVIRAKLANTGKIFVGGSDVASTTNEGLAAGDALPIPGPLDLAHIYINASVDGEGVDFYASKV